MKTAVKTRPAESVGATGGLAGFVIAVAEHNWTAACIALVGFLPAIVTFLVENGGIKGELKSIWKGRNP